MTEIVHRKCSRVEWADSAASPTPTNPAQRPAIVNNVIGASLVAIDKKAYLLGGVNPRTGRTIAQSLEYDTITKQWSNLGLWLPVPISDAAAVSCGAVVVLFGGWNDEQLSSDVWIVANKVDELGGGGVTIGSWRRATCTGPAPSPRRSHAMVATPPREDGSFTVYVFGGFDGEQRCNDLWSLDIASDGTPSSSWVLLPPAGERPSGRDACAFGYDAVRRRLVVFGGFTVALDQELYTYTLPPSPSAASTPRTSSPENPSGAYLQWVKGSSHVVPTRRQHAFGVCHHNYFIAMFGHDGKQALSQICQYNLQEGKWSLVTFEGDEIEARLSPSSCLAEGGKKVLVFGGQGPKGRYLSSLLELELEKCEAAAPVKGKK